jgi:hypothetical protein
MSSEVQVIWRQESPSPAQQAAWERLWAWLLAAPTPETMMPLAAVPRGRHDDDADFPGDSKRLDTPDDNSETSDAV